MATKKKQKPAAMLHIGAEKDSIKAIEALIVTVFCVAQQTNMEQDTVRLALQFAMKSLSVDNTTITGCSFKYGEND